MSIVAKTFRVPLADNLRKSVTVNPKATEGAVLGVNLTDADGKPYTVDQIVNPKAPDPNQPVVADLSENTTDDLEEGAENLYFTDERAQDAVGFALLDSANIAFTYDDADNKISADLTDVAPVTGGAMALWGFDSKGRLAESDDATTDDLPEGVTNLYYTEDRVDDRIAALALFNRIDASGDIRVTANGDLRVTS